MKNEQTQWNCCHDHQYPYGVNIDDDDRPRCVWCESLRADALERRVVEMNRQLEVAEKLLSNATPHPTFLSMEQQEKWAKDFGKWWAKRMAR